MRKTATAERQVEHPRVSSMTMTVERERVRYTPIARNVGDGSNVYFGAPLVLVSKPYPYISKTNGKLYKAPHDTLRHLMSDHPASLSRLNRSHTWSRARNGALVAGSRRTASSILPGAKYHPGDPPKESPYSFQIASTLIAGFAALAGATFWTGMWSRHFGIASGTTTPT